MKYTCSKCRQEHEGRPALGFGSPYHYDILRQEEKDSIATLSDDFCTIIHQDQTGRLLYLCDVEYNKIWRVNRDADPNLNLTTLFELAKGLDVHPKELIDSDFAFHKN